MADTGYDKYIVTFKDTATDEQIEEHMKELVEEHGGVVTNEYDTALKGYAAYIPPAFLESLQNNLQDDDSIIEAIEADGTVTALPENEPTGGASRRFAIGFS